MTTSIHTPIHLKNALPRTALFPSFFGAGFECSMHVDRNGRQDLVGRTQHDRFLCDDYARIAALGLLTVREGVPWYRVAQRGTGFDFAPVVPFVDAAREFGMTVIWDLFHYGYPDHLDPFGEQFLPEFARYCGAFARFLMERGGDNGPRFYTVMNEPSFFAWAGGEEGVFAPFVTGRGFDLKLRLARACIAGIDAIRAVDPQARFVNVDPVIHTVPPADEPRLAEDSTLFNEFQWQFWDILCGREWPEFGGSPAHLDVIGVNHYLHGQWEHCRPGWLAFDDPRRRPFSAILADVAARYPAHPLLISETGCRGDMRAVWFEHTVDGAMGAIANGVDLQGVCLYPIIDMPDWYSGEWIEYGMWDLVPESDQAHPAGVRMRRRLYRPLRDALLRAQKRLGGARMLPTTAVAA
jgi:beta-glucosidase/6-phospho-beta-glucosidase/beta-galactosidase